MEKSGAGPLDAQFLWPEAETEPAVDIPLSKGRVDELKRLWNL